MQSLSYQEMLEIVQGWDGVDQLKFIEAVAASIRQRIEGQQRQEHVVQEEQHEETQRSIKPLYDVRDFRGISHGTWNDVGGVDEFIKQERASWDT